MFVLVQLITDVPVGAFQRGGGPGFVLITAYSFLGLLYRQDRAGAGNAAAGTCHAFQQIAVILASLCQSHQIQMMHHCQQ